MLLLVLVLLFCSIIIIIVVFFFFFFFFFIIIISSSSSLEQPLLTPLSIPLPSPRTRFTAQLELKMQTTVLKGTVAPYQEVKISWLASQLGMEVEKCEALLVKLILSDELAASIDQHSGFLVVNGGGDADPGELKYRELARWADALKKGMEKVSSKAANKHDSSYGGIGRHTMSGLLGSGGGMMGVSDMMGMGGGGRRGGGRRGRW